MSSDALEANKFMSSRSSLFDAVLPPERKRPAAARELRGLLRGLLRMGSVAGRLLLTRDGASMLRSVSVLRNER